MRKYLHTLVELSTQKFLCSSCDSEFMYFLQTERDISVRQRAIDLLYAMCDHSNAKTIVEELLHYLETADFSIRETLVSGDGVIDKAHTL